MEYLEKFEPAKYAKKKRSKKVPSVKKTSNSRISDKKESLRPSVQCFPGLNTNTIWIFPDFTKPKYIGMTMNKTKNRGTATNRNVASATTIVRDSNGRFASTASTKKTASTTIKGKVSTTVNSKVPTSKVTTNTRSSFIKSMIVNSDNTVSVVMVRNPKTVYTYKPTSKGLSKIQTTLKNNRSLGDVYNSQLKGREIYRTMYR